jgi:hypothetical protein
VRYVCDNIFHPSLFFSFAISIVPVKTKKRIPDAHNLYYINNNDIRKTLFHNEQNIKNNRLTNVSKVSTIPRHTPQSHYYCTRTRPSVGGVNLSSHFNTFVDTYYIIQVRLLRRISYVRFIIS